jgi:hypothetical protein
MDARIRRNNEKRGSVSEETLSDRKRMKDRLQGNEQTVQVLKPILVRVFFPRPLKKSLLQYLQMLGLRNGYDTVDRLAKRHLDVLVAEFIKRCPDMYRQLLNGQTQTIREVQEEEDLTLQDEDLWDTEETTEWSLNESDWLS